MVIIVLTYVFIYKEAIQKDGFTGLIQVLMDRIHGYDFLLGLILVFFLMFLNWFLETIKWRFLIRKIEKVSLVRSFEAVLTGVSISSFTPNRVGEFFGRVFILKSSNPVEGILITVIGSMSQLLITLLSGSVALIIFVHQYFSDLILFHGYLYYAFIAVIIVFDLIILGLFFNVSFLSAIKERIIRNGFQKIRSYFRVFDFYHYHDLIIVFCLSLFRYIVFSFQYFLLLRLFRVPVPLGETLLLTSMIYFVMAIIPTIALSELGIRGSVALYMFGLYFTLHGLSAMDFNQGILAASTLLWVVNLGIPAILGSIFVFRLQFFRKP